jgi:hypothetical protein
MDAEKDEELLLLSLLGPLLGRQSAAVTCASVMEWPRAASRSWNCGAVRKPSSATSKCRQIDRHVAQRPHGATSASYPSPHA